ncbi:MAG: EamA family transporter [Mucispirillum sp.]|nr:EamA family transporter [Mucispirillum sp.]
MPLVADRKTGLTLFCLTALYMTWGMVYLSIRFALESFPPVMLSGIRYMSAGSIFLIWTFLVKKDKKLPSKKDIITSFVTSLFMIVISGAFLNISGVYIDSGTVALIMGSIPMWIVLVSWLKGYDKRPSFSVFIGLAGGFIGVAALAVSTGITGGKNSVLGIIAIFISIAGWVAGSLYVKGTHTDMPIIKSLGFQMTIGGVIMLLISALIGEWSSFHVEDVTLKSFLSGLHLIFFGSIVGYVCYIWLLYNTPTPIAISYAYAEPVVAVIAGAVFAGEKIGGVTVAACVLIIASVFFVIKGGNR